MKKVVGRFVSNGFWVSLSAVISAGTLHAEDGEYLIDEEVIVQGVRQADLNARERERMKDIFSSVIATDDLGNFADQNVAEALQRLPGVTLQKSDGQGQFVNVRGLGPSFVGVTLNNSELASASSTGRAVGLNTIPADLMGSIEVYKSLTPDMDLNSIGGKVNVNSVTAFDRGKDSLRATVQGSMHEQRGEFAPKATLVGTKLLADETIGIAASLSYEKRETEVNQITADTEEPLNYIRMSQPYVGATDPDGLGRPQALSSTQFMDRYFAGSSTSADPFIDSPRMLIPVQFEIRQDESIRTRIGGTLDFGWRPNENSDYFIRYAYTDYTDEELTLRENYRFVQSSGDARRIVTVMPEENFFAMANTDLRHRVYIQEATEITEDFAIGGENILFDTWTVDYEYHKSKGERENPDDRRVQFRTRALPMYGQIYKDDIIAGIIDDSQLTQLADAAGAEYQIIGGMGGFGSGFSEGVVGYRLGARRQPNMIYDNILLESGIRLDEVESFDLNLKMDFEGGGFLNYLKGGVQVKERKRSNNQAELDINPGDFPPTLCVDANGAENRTCLEYANTRIGRAGFETYTPRNPRFDHDFITIHDAELLLANTRLIPENLDPDRSGATSLDDNYSIYEDSFAGYLMAEFQLSDKATLIAGARYSYTEYGSTGWLTLRHDRFAQEDGILRDIAIPLGSPDTGGFAINEYDGVYPGVHLRYEPRDDMLIRASLWTSFNRPEFDEANVYAKFSGRVVLCTDAPLPNEEDCGDNLTDDLGATGDLDQYARDHFSLAPGGNALEVGNSDLKAMEATHFDASLSWYGEGGHFFEVAVFYKDIVDFIVDVRGIDVPRDFMPLAIRQALDQIDVNVSGGDQPNRNRNVFAIAPDFVFQDVSTTINGDRAEVYGLETSYARFFDSGWFVSGNLTLLDSKADAGATVRAEKVPLPNQADLTANLVLGWESDRYSVRLISNHRSEVLKEIGSCSQADIEADAEWARLNDTGNPDALSGATGDGTVYAERCQRWADVFHDDIFSMDFKATYNPWDNVKIYLDVLNITEDIDVFYYRGNEHSRGNLLQFTEGIGRTYQAGLNINF
jgi:iron complex outermembrane recepter protein